MQADAGKTGGTVESLLIKHAKLDKTWATMARLQWRDGKKVVIAAGNSYECRVEVNDFLEPFSYRTLSIMMLRYG
jgi:hypothetical protein